MQVLEGTSLLYYVVLHIFCIALLTAVLAGYMNGNWRKKADPRGRIATLIIFQIISLACLIFIAVVRAYATPSMFFWGYVFSIMWMSVIFLTIAFWSLFVEETNDRMLNRDDKRRFLWFAPGIVIMVLAVTTPYTHLIFSLQDSGGYVLGPLFRFTVLFYNLSYACIAIRALIIARKSIYVDKQRMFLMFSCIPVILIFSGYFRKFELPCLLHSLSAVIVYIFMARDSEKKAQEKLMGLAEEFAAVFMIDVDKNGIYSVAINDKRVLSLDSAYWRKSYSETVKAITEMFIAEDEQKRVLEEMEGETIFAHLLKERTFIKSFFITDEKGESRYYSIHFVRSNTPGKRRFTMGVKNIDSLTRSRIRRDEILKGIAEDYDAVLYIDTVNMRPEERYILNPKFEAIMPLWTDMKEFESNFNVFISTHVAAEDRERFRRENAGEYVVEHLKKKNSYICNFKMIANGKIVYYQLKYIAKKQDDNIIGIVLGFKNVDEERRKELEVEAQNSIRSDILNVLAYEYSILLFGNINNRICNVVYLSENIHVADIGEDNEASMRDAYEKYIMDAVHPEEREMVMKALSPEEIRLQLTGKKRFSLTIRCKFDDSYKFFELAVAKAEEADEEAKNIAIGLAEIDNEYRTQLEQERQLKNALEEADASSNAKSTFLFNMSHDIRTPLNAIIGFAELAGNHVDEPEVMKDYLSKINLSGNHLLKLVNEVLDMSRIESGKINTETVPTSMLEMADNVVNICKESARNKGILLKLRADGVSNRTILADELHVHQILMNVIGNSIKYTPEGGSITFKVREVSATKAGYARYHLSISDTGKGMSEDYLNHIYDYFSQERTSGRSGIEGTGLGMAIVKRLVDFMEGKIDIKSEIGKGTTVNITLQFPVQTLKSLSGQEQADVEISLAGKRILVVEDNDMNREIAIEIMKANKLTAEEAVDGLQALDIIKKKGTDYFDYVLMDIQMPVMNGYESTAEIRKLPGGDKIVIIALSANAFEEDRIKSKSAGMDAHVAKPINIKELMRALRAFAR